MSLLSTRPIRIFLQVLPINLAMPRVALQHGAVSSRTHVLNRAKTLSESATLKHSASDETEPSTSEQALQKLAAALRNDVRLVELQGDGTTTPKPKPTRKSRAPKPAKSAEPKVTQRKQRAKATRADAPIELVLAAAQLPIPAPLPIAKVAKIKATEEIVNVAGERITGTTNVRQSRPRVPQAQACQVTAKSSSQRSKRKQSSSSSSSDYSTDSSRDSSSSSGSSSSSSSHSPSSRSSSSSSSASDRSAASAKTSKKHRAGKNGKNKQIKKKKTAKRKTRRDDEFIVVKDPPRFSGTMNDTDVKSYKSKAKEFLSQFKSRSTSFKLNALRMGLSGPAREAFRRNRRTIKSPKSLFAMLAEYYPRAKVDPGIIVQQLKQERGEPVSVFRVRVETAVSESGFKTISRAEQAKWGISVFRRGLRPEIREKLGFAKFRSLKKTVKAAMAVESGLNELNGMHGTESHQKGHRGYKRPRSPRSDKRYSEPYEKHPRYTSPHRSDARHDSNDRYYSESHHLNAMDNSTERPRASYQSSSQRTRFPILCFYCGRTGHRVYHCRDASEKDRRAVQDSFTAILAEVRQNTFTNFKDFSRRRQPSQQSSSKTTTASVEPPKSPAPSLNSSIAASSSQ